MAKYTYFRLYATKGVHNGSSANYLCMAMFQLFNAAGQDFARTDGVVYTADSIDASGSEPEKAFNGYPNYRYLSASSAFPHWLCVQLPEAQELAYFVLCPRTSPTYRDWPTDFELQGSNDGTAWDTLYTATNLTTGWSPGAKRYFEVQPGSIPTATLDRWLNTVDGMTCTRNNSKQDDGTDTLTGVDWFKFNGQTVSSVYVSGNLWVGLGANSEQLKVWRRDAAIYYVWRQAGSINGTNFLKIRVEGYVVYNSTSSDYQIVYELFLFDDGRMLLYCVFLPNSSTGTTSLTCGSQTLTLTLPARITDQGNNVLAGITLTPTDKDAGTGWQASSALPSFALHRYLLAYGGKYYTVQDGTLAALDNVTELSAAVFQEHGTLTPPSADLLTPLSNPTIYHWTDADTIPALSATVTATPPDQPLIALCDMHHSSILGIDTITGENTGGVTVAESYDEGESYGDAQPLTDFLAADPDTIWETLPDSRKLVLRFTLHPGDTLTNVKIKFKNTEVPTE